MRGTGLEPAQALSYWILSPARLTTPAPSLKHSRKNKFLIITEWANSLTEQLREIKFFR